MGSTGEKNDTIKAPPPPPIAPCTLSCGWLSRTPFLLSALWFAAFALWNPAGWLGLPLPANVGVRSALRITLIATVTFVLASKSGLVAVRPRALGWLKNTCAKTSQKSDGVVNGKGRSANLAVCACENDE